MMSKKSEEKAFSGSRLMNKSIPQYLFAQNAFAPAPWDDSKNGWSYNVTTGGQRYLAYQTYFDLSGYSLSDLTTQPMSVILQEASEYISVPDAGSPRTHIEVLDVLSSERPNPNSLLEDMVDQNGPGYSLSELAFDQVLWSQYRTYIQNTTVWTNTGGIMSEHTRLIGGSGNAVAVDKLWITRIIFPNGVYDVDPATFMRFPASNVVLNAAIYKEDELPYLMRLKRSYELGTS